MYTSMCKLSDPGLHQVNSVGLQGQTRNFHVQERENNFDDAVNCQEYVVSLGNGICGNGILKQRKDNPCNHKNTSPSANADSTNPTWISLGLNLDPYDNGM